MEKTLEKTVAACKSRVKAYVLIETTSGRKKEVIEAVNGLEGVISVEVIGGAYDVVALIEGESWDRIANLISTSMNLVKGIYRVTTCPVGFCRD